MNKLIAIGLALFMLQGCAGVNIQGGLAVHPDIDAPEYSAHNPLGIVRVSKKVSNTTFFYEHVSSVIDREEGAGLNMTGILIGFN